MQPNKPVRHDSFPPVFRSSKKTTLFFQGLEARIALIPRSSTFYIFAVAAVATNLGAVGMGRGGGRARGYVAGSLALRDSFFTMPSDTRCRSAMSFREPSPA
jgi:hypothetical protein